MRVFVLADKADMARDFAGLMAAYDDRYDVSDGSSGSDIVYGVASDADALADGSLQGDLRYLVALRAPGDGPVANALAQTVSSGVTPDGYDESCVIDVEYMRPDDPARVVRYVRLVTRLASIFDASGLYEVADADGGARPLYRGPDGDGLVSAEHIVANALMDDHALSFLVRNMFLVEHMGGID